MLHRSTLIAGKGHECFISKTCEIEGTKIRQLSNIICVCSCAFVCTFAIIICLLSHEGKAPQRTVFVLLRACVVRKPAINVQISGQYIPKSSLEIASFGALKSCNAMD